MSNLRYVLAFFLMVSLTIVIAVWSFYNIDTDRVSVIQKCTFEGNKYHTANNYLKEVGLPEITKLKGLTPAELRLALLKHPYIEDVRVELNDSLTAEVEVVEQEMFALIQNEGKQFFLTKEMKAIEIRPNTDSLNFPLITNTMLRNITNLSIIQSSDIIEAYSIIRAAKFAGNDMINSLSEINLRNGGEIVLTISKMRPLILFGHSDIARKIIYLAELQNNEQISKTLKNSVYVDIRFSKLVFMGIADNMEI